MPNEEVEDEESGLMATKLAKIVGESEETSDEVMVSQGICIAYIRQFKDLMILN